MPNDSPDLYEMVGTLVEWDGANGYMLSDEGERVDISYRFADLLARHSSSARKFALSVGCRVHCIVSMKVEYSLNKIRLVEPRAPDVKEVACLKQLGKDVAARQHGRSMADVMFRETFSGTIVSVNRRTKSGVIRLDDGVEMPFFRLWGIKKGQRLTQGMQVRFEAYQHEGEWVVSGIRFPKKT